MDFSLLEKSGYVVYSIYRITHPIDKMVNYIGSSMYDNLSEEQHRIESYTDRHTGFSSYNKPLYKYIRDNNINFDDLIFQLLYKTINSKDINTLKSKYITQFDTVKNGLNGKLYYTMKAEKAQKQKERESIRVKCLICDKELRTRSFSRHVKNIHKNQFNILFNRDILLSNLTFLKNQQVSFEHLLSLF